MLHNDESFDRISPRMVGHADDSAFEHLRQGHDARLDLGAVNVKTAADNHVFLAVHDVNVAVFVDVSDIASVMPAVAANFSSGLRQVVVSGSDQRRSEEHTSELQSLR